MSESYIRCPRCELNYILKKDKYCEVCKQELKISKSNSLEETLEETSELCPICKTNYLNEDEVICASCAKEKALEDGMYVDNDHDSDWEEFIEDNDAILDNEDLGEMVSITDGDEEDDGEDEEDQSEDDDEDFDFDDDDDYDDDDDDDYDDDEDDNDDDEFKDED